MHRNNFVRFTIAMLLVPLAASGQQYKAVNLGTLGGAAPAGSEGRDINDSGRITGWSFSGKGPMPQAFITSAATSVLTSIGDGFNKPEGTGINSSGQISGIFISNDFYNRTHAFVTNAATNAIIDLGTLACGTSYYCNGDSYGNGINQSGQVTGYSSIATYINTYHAFVTNAETNSMTDLGTLGGPDSEGYGINAGGQVTGWADTAGDPVAHAFITNAATNAITDLGTLGGTNSQGLGINASGEVVGWADTSTNTQDGFLYSNGQMLDLNSLLTPSDSLLYTITEATGINDHGQIVANGHVNVTGQDVAFLLNPTAPAQL